MDTIIDIVLFNGYIDFSNLQDVLFINKATYKITKEYINIHLDNYVSGKTFKKPNFIDAKFNKIAKLCSTCSITYTKSINPFTNKPLCKKCTSKKLINKTNARKIYKIKDSEFSMIDFHCYHISQYRLGYLYNLDTIKYISILKLIKDNNERLLNPNKLTKRQIREKQVNELLKEYNIQDENEVYHITTFYIIHSFIQNGSYGIRKVRKTVHEWREFYDFIRYDIKAVLVINDINLHDYFESYLDDKECVIGIINIKYDIMLSTKEKEDNLIKALKGYNIFSDYKCKAYYEYISNRTDDLKSTVDKIREYHFFIFNTSFIEIRTNRLNIIARYNQEEDIISIDSVLKNIDYLSKVEALSKLGDKEHIPPFIKLKYL